MKRKVVLSLSICGLLLSTPLASAETLLNDESTQSIKQIESQLQKQNEDIEHITSQQDQLKIKIHDFELKIQGLQINKVQQESEILNLKRSINNLEGAVYEVETSIEKRKEMFKKRALSLQDEDRSMAVLRIILNAESFSDFLGRLGAASTIMENDQAMVDQYEKEQKRLKVLKDDKAKRLEEVKKENEKLKAIEQELLAEKAEQEGLINKLEKSKLNKILSKQQLENRRLELERERQALEEKQQMEWQQRHQVNVSSPVAFSATGYDVRNISAVTAAQIDAMLEGRLKGYGGKYYEVGHKYNINPAFLASISMAETGGTDIDDRNNVGGLMKPGKGKMSFTSIDDCIEYMGLLLIRMYINDGLVTVDQIHTRYSPDGADNDPNNLNSNWVANVYKFMRKAGVSI
ncbi:hypothetical protein [Bacillus sp. 1P06AnD]|uniref:coiled-coil domain-containing protein n=1 Tax=Bacillus sp. 1P06AnD TaxID=3132208 RepID=UPI0039A38068